MSEDVKRYALKYEQLESIESRKFYLQSLTADQIRQIFVRIVKRLLKHFNTKLHNSKQPIYSQTSTFHDSLILGSIQPSRPAKLTFNNVSKHLIQGVKLCSFEYHLLQTLIYLPVWKEYLQFEINRWWPSASEIILPSAEVMMNVNRNIKAQQFEVYALQYLFQILDHHNENEDELGSKAALEVWRCIERSNTPLLKKILVSNLHPPHFIFHYLLLSEKQCLLSDFQSLKSSSPSSINIVERTSKPKKKNDGKKSKKSSSSSSSSTTTNITSAVISPCCFCSYLINELEMEITQYSRLEKPKPLKVQRMTHLKTIIHRLHHSTYHLFLNMISSLFASNNYNNNNENDNNDSNNNSSNSGRIEMGDEYYKYEIMKYLFNYHEFEVETNHQSQSTVYTHSTSINTILSQLLKRHTHLSEAFFRDMSLNLNTNNQYLKLLNEPLTTPRSILHLLELLGVNILCIQRRTSNLSDDAILRFNEHIDYLPLSPEHCLLVHRLIQILSSPPSTSSSPPPLSSSEIRNEEFSKLMQSQPTLLKRYLRTILDDHDATDHSFSLHSSSLHIDDYEYQTTDVNDSHIISLSLFPPSSRSNNNNNAADNDVNHDYHFSQITKKQKTHHGGDSFYSFADNDDNNADRSSLLHSRYQQQLRVDDHSRIEYYQYYQRSIIEFFKCKDGISMLYSLLDNDEPLSPPPSSSSSSSSSSSVNTSFKITLQTPYLSMLLSPLPQASRVTHNPHSTSLLDDHRIYHAMTINITQCIMHCWLYYYSSPHHQHDNTSTSLSSSLFLQSLLHIRKSLIDDNNHSTSTHRHHHNQRSVLSTTSMISFSAMNMKHLISFLLSSYVNIGIIIYQRMKIYRSRLNDATKYQHQQHQHYYQCGLIFISSDQPPPPPPSPHTSSFHPSTPTPTFISSSSSTKKVVITMETLWFYYSIHYMITYTLLSFFKSENPPLPFSASLISSLLSSFSPPSTSISTEGEISKMIIECMMNHLQLQVERVDVFLQHFYDVMMINESRLQLQRNDIEGEENATTTIIIQQLVLLLQLMMLSLNIIIMSTQLIDRIFIYWNHSHSHPSLRCTPISLSTYLAVHQRYQTIMRDISSLLSHHPFLSSSPNDQSSSSSSSSSSSPLSLLYIVRSHLRSQLSKICKRICKQLLIPITLGTSPPPPSSSSSKLTSSYIGSEGMIGEFGYEKLSTGNYMKKSKLLHHHHHYQKHRLLSISILRSRPIWCLFKDIIITIRGFWENDMTSHTLEYLSMITQNSFISSSFFASLNPSSYSPPHPSPSPSPSTMNDDNNMRGEVITKEWLLHSLSEYIAVLLEMISNNVEMNGSNNSSSSSNNNNIAIIKSTMRIITSMLSAPTSCLLLLCSSEFISLLLKYQSLSSSSSSSSIISPPSLSRSPHPPHHSSSTHHRGEGDLRYHSTFIITTMMKHAFSHSDDDDEEEEETGEESGNYNNNNEDDEEVNGGNAEEESDVIIGMIMNDKMRRIKAEIRKRSIQLIMDYQFTTSLLKIIPQCNDHHHLPLLCNIFEALYNLISPIKLISAAEMMYLGKNHPHPHLQYQHQRKLKYTAMLMEIKEKIIIRDMFDIKFGFFSSVVCLFSSPPPPSSSSSSSSSSILEMIFSDVDVLKNLYYIINQLIEDTDRLVKSKTSPSLAVLFKKLAPLEVNRFISFCNAHSTSPSSSRFIFNNNNNNNINNNNNNTSIVYNNNGGGGRGLSRPSVQSVGRGGVGGSGVEQVMISERYQSLHFDLFLKMLRTILNSNSEVLKRQFLDISTFFRHSNFLPYLQLHHSYFLTFSEFRKKLNL